MKKDPLGNSTKEVARNNPQEVKLTKLETVKSEEETCSSSEDEKSRIKINVGGGSLRKRREDGRRAVERAKANFKSHKHFFIAYIQQSYVTGSRGLVIMNYSTSIFSLYKLRKQFFYLFPWMHPVAVEFRKILA